MIARIALAVASATAAALLVLAPVHAVGEASPNFDCVHAAGAQGDPTDGMEAVYGSWAQIIACEVHAA